MIPGGDDDPIGSIAQHLIGAHLADAEMYLDVFLQLAQLSLPVGDDSAPFLQPRQGRDRPPMAAEFALGFAQVHGVAALTQDSRALHPRGTAADDQHAAGVSRAVEFLRMPAAPVLLADGYILRAHDLAALLELRHADVAADALADVLHPALGDLGRQKGIGNGRTRGADDVEHAGANQSDHVVGAGQPAVPDPRNVRPENGFSLLDEGRHPAGFAKARCSRILAPFRVIADLERHQIDRAFAAAYLQG